MVYGVIMAGGKGERFWPLSRVTRPKQFLKLTSDKTMLDETVARVKPIIPLENMRIVTGESMADIVLNSVEYLSEQHILIEPVGRNTALAIGLAAVHIRHIDENAVMIVLSADHLIKPVDKLLQILKDGAQIASDQDVLITIGIVPTRPETGYGYIKLGSLCKYGTNSAVYEVAEFTEKPKAMVAQEYYYNRQHLWNAGMFIWSAKSILKSLENNAPEIYALLDEYSKSIGTPAMNDARKKLYDEAQSISIDYAVLEKAKNVLTIRADIVWDDVGSWNALDRYKERDSENNIIIGESIIHETYETTILNEDEGIIACLGVSDLVVVRSANITMVAHKTKVGKIKELLAKLQSDEKTQKYL